MDVLSWDVGVPAEIAAGTANLQTFQELNRMARGVLFSSLFQPLNTKEEAGGAFRRGYGGGRSRKPTRPPSLFQLLQKNSGNPLQVPIERFSVAGLNRIAFLAVQPIQDSGVRVKLAEMRAKLLHDALRPLPFRQILDSPEIGAKLRAVPGGGGIAAITPVGMFAPATRADHFAFPFSHPSTSSGSRCSHQENSPQMKQARFQVRTLRRMIET